MSRPAPRFHEFVGHKRLVNRLKRLLAGAMTRKEAFGHTLLLGPSGVGKTRLARSLATEYGTAVVEAMGYHTRQDLAQLFATLKDADFLLIDECHRLGPLEQELVCEAIEQHSIPDPTPAADKEKGGRISVPPWTLMLCTDQPGRLLDALQKRVLVRVELGYYQVRELKEIVELLAGSRNMLVSPQAARIIAAASGGLPRTARHHLDGLRHFFPDSEKRQVGVPEVREFLRAFGVSKAGLGPLERRYLRQLNDYGRASVETMALALGVDMVYLRRTVEASLVRARLIEIQPGGRRLTKRGLRLVRKGSASNKVPANKEMP